jgi:hypothetical protein
MPSEIISLGGVCPNSILINSEKSATELNGPHFTEVENYLRSYDISNLAKC